MLKPKAERLSVPQPRERDEVGMFLGDTEPRSTCFSIGTGFRPRTGL